ncbi:MAG: glycosyltransferase family 2 protein [Candidatus Delongbacteria bacterium]|jgi:glycosyltransferase involved in cell wall biosynthesis|nr:glycosyltransferase family 2 protein [Candidatus Delongbacteria bacterium]
MIISVIIPLYNEEDIIDEFHQRVLNAMTKTGDDFEVIYVDDGSTDNTLQKLLNYHKKDSRFKVLELSRNFGHQAAYTAGLNVTLGDYVCMLDGDLQDPPELIPEMYEKLSIGNYDIVYGKRISRKEKAGKRFFILLFHKIFSFINNVGAPDNVGNFGMMNHKAKEAFLMLKEKNRYLPGLRYFIGFRQTAIEYKRPERTRGKAKMNIKSLMQLAFDALFSLSKLPLKLAFVFGFTGLGLSLVGAVVVIIKKITGAAITGWTSMMLSLFFFGSVILIFLGVMGEYIFRIYKETQNRPVYFIRNYHTKDDKNQNS